jgi:transcriptional regulator with XRE-family HTH domain
MADTDTGKPTPIGDYVVSAIEELRAARGLSLRQLADRLGALGHPVQTSAVHAIVQGRRKVSPDELVALALALDVNTNALQLPRHVGRDDIVELTPKASQRANVTWDWADGRFPLPPELLPAGTLAVGTPGERHAFFTQHARPDIEPRQVDPAVEELRILMRMLLNVIERPDQLTAWAEWRDTILRRFRLVAIQLEELIVRLDREAFAGAGFQESATAAAQAEVADAVNAMPRTAAPPPGADERYRLGAQADRARMGQSRIIGGASLPAPPPGPHGAATSVTGAQSVRESADRAMWAGVDPDQHGAATSKTVDPLDPFGERDQ